jgi:hypothetical protein
MRVAVLSWGSLIWDRQELAIAGDFMPCGPHLPVEFYRVSGDGRLTLVIDETFGAFCSTYSAMAASGDLSTAIENLRMREGMPGAKGVWFVDAVSGRHSAEAMKRDLHAVAGIKAWAQANGFDAAMWTALSSNFHEPGKAAEPFSVKAAIRYLETRDDPTLRTALDYIRKAPQEVRTPVRTPVAQRWPEG